MRLAYSAFYGLPQSRFDGCGYSVRAMRADPDRIVRRHGHDGAHVIAVLSGKYLSLASSGAPLGAMDIVYNPHGVEHADTFDGENGAFLALSFDPLRFPRVTGDAPEPFMLRKPHALAAIMRILAQLKSPSSKVPELIEDNVIALADCAAPLAPETGNAVPPAWALAARDQLCSAEARIGIVDLAAGAGMHPVAFSRAIRRYFGKAPLELALEFRLTNAARQLARGNRPISQIGLRWGFYDQAHFSRLFRRRFGAPPGAFRRIFQS